MRKYLELLLDLLEIIEKESYYQIAEQIESLAPGVQVCFAHRASFIFDAYLKLLGGELAPEEFILLGDVESAIPLWQEGNQTADSVIHELLDENLPEQEVIMLDLSVWNVLLTQEQRTQIKNLLETHHKILILG